MSALTPSLISRWAIGEMTFVQKARKRSIMVAAGYPPAKTGDDRPVPETPSWADAPAPPSQVPRSGARRRLPRGRPDRRGARVLGAAPAPPPRDVQVGSLTLRPCDVVARALCGKIRRNWDPDRPGAGKVTVGFAFVPARRGPADRHPGPARGRAGLRHDGLGVLLRPDVRRPDGPAEPAARRPARHRPVRADRLPRACRSSPGPTTSRPAGAAAGSASAPTTTRPPGRPTTWPPCSRRSSSRTSTCTATPTARSSPRSSPGGTPGWSAASPSTRRTPPTASRAGTRPPRRPRAGPSTSPASAPPTAGPAAGRSAAP